MRVIRNVLMPVIVAVCIGATPRTRPTTVVSSRPTTRRVKVDASEASRAAVRAAVEKLAEEFRDHLTDLREHQLRASCNYFDQSAAAKILPETLIASLTRHTTDVRENCYINWQLLSALPAKLDTAMATALLTVYRNSPPPIARPGVSREDQPKLDVMFKGKSMADEADVKHQWEQILDAAAKENAPILAYRDELYHRLPQGFDTFAAAMEDLLARMNAVVDAKSRVKQLVIDVKKWAATESASPQQLSTLANAVRKLADSKSPQYYVSPYWRESSGAFVWRKSRTGIETGHELKDLATFLDEQARQPVLKLDPKGLAKQRN